VPGCRQQKTAPKRGFVGFPAGSGSALVPEVGLEPTSLAAEDFHPTSAFAAAHADVRGLEHAFTLALRL